MAHFILREIKDYICKSQFMAIMTDSTTDVSGEERLVQMQRRCFLV